GGRGAGRRFGRLSGAGTGRGIGRRGRLLAGAGAAAVALVTLVGAIQAGGRDGDGTAVETSGGRDGDRSGSTADRDGGPRPPASGSGSTTAPSVTTPPGPTSTTVGEGGSGGAGGTPSGPGTPAIPASEPLAPAPGGSSPGGPSPSDPPPTTATTARDATGPSITELSVTPGMIDEDGFEFCERPKTAQVSATVSDPSGVTGVIVSWSGNGMSGSTEMAAMGSTWQGTLGPVPDSQLTVGDGPVPITWSVTAVDGAGNSATKGGPTLSMYGC
ncbi:MAG: hypothetical protein JXA83_04930, partial [Acidimicrobiales bacterium]|nr:hypothetical protein [Acidimicrobiales bacterium]